LKVSDYGGQDRTITIANNGWLKWSNPKISDIQILTNRIRISVIVKANAGNWGWIDQFELVKR
ncbi:MAG TPA: arabinogalactan endo-1,4-beta-galactosidase, partial [Pseudothermotoga sp.]